MSAHTMTLSLLAANAIVNGNPLANGNAAPTTAQATLHAGASAFASDLAGGQLPQLVLGATLNLAVAVIIVRFIYYPVTRDRSYVFSFLAFSTVIYFVLALLTTVPLSMGIGFGLFAIFSVLRYRTDTIPIREMTYLFVVIALPVMNSVMMNGGSFPHLAFANAMVIGTVYALEKQWGFRFQGRKQIVYERMDLIPPARRAALLADLRQRTGLPITRVEVGLIDFLRDTAEVTIYYEEDDPAVYASVAPTELPSPKPALVQPSPPAIVERTTAAPGEASTLTAGARAAETNAHRA